jgi:hypothetical protein
LREVDGLQVRLDDDGPMIETSQGACVHPALPELGQRGLAVARLFAALPIPLDDDEGRTARGGAPRGIYAVRTVSRGAAHQRDTATVRPCQTSGRCRRAPSAPAGRCPRPPAGTRNDPLPAIAAGSSRVGISRLPLFGTHDIQATPVSEDEAGQPVEGSAPGSAQRL